MPGVLTASRLARPVRRALLVCVLPATAYGQDDVPKLSSLKPTGSPAFILLGASPSAIERPTSPADFGLMLVNRAQNLSSVPSDFAAEIAPYWLTSRTDLTWRQDIDRNLAQSIMRSAALSAASAAIGTDDAPVSGLSIGARMQLLSGTLSTESQALLDMLERSLAAEGALLQRMMSTRLAALDALLSARLREAAALSSEGLRAAAQAAAVAAHESAKRQLVAEVTESAAFQDSIAAGRKRFENLVLERVGPQVEIAGAAGWTYPNAVWDQGAFDRWGIWASFSWSQSTARGTGPQLTPLALVRYVAQRSDTLPDYLDLGGRLMLSNERYGISAEFVMRDPRGNVTANDDSVYRLVGAVEYQLRSDTWALVTFGRDHDTARQGSLVAQLGLRFQFAQERYKLPLAP